MLVATLLALAAQGPAHEIEGMAELLWESVNPGGPPDPRTVGSLATSSDGSVLFAGVVEGSAGGTRPGVVAMDPGTGGVIWSTVFVPTGGADGFGASGLVHAAATDRVYVAFLRPGVPSFHDDLAIACLRASDGALLWQSEHVLGGSAHASIDLVASPDGARVFAASDLNGPPEFLTTSLVVGLDGATGTELWSLAPTSPGGSATVGGLAVSPDGSTLYASGSQGGTFPTVVRDVTVHAWDAATGAQLWKTVEDTSLLPAAVHDEADSLRLSADGSTLYAGVTRAVGNSGSEDRMGALAVDAATGAIAWSFGSLVVPGPLGERVSIDLDEAGGRLLLGGIAVVPGSTHPKLFGASLELSSGLLQWYSTVDTTAFGTSVAGVAARPGGAGVTLVGRADQRVAVTSFRRSDGALLWSDRIGTTSGGVPELGTAIAADPAGNRIFTGGQFHDGSLGGAGAVFAHREPILRTSVDEVSAAAGGALTFELDLGANGAAHPFLLLGSLSGTSPGAPLGAVLVPLVPDLYTVLLLEQVGEPAFPGGFGALDASGAGSATLTIAPGLTTALVGLTAHHAAVVFDPGTFAAKQASQAHALDFAP